jgi:hypothetical protein
LNLIIAIFRSGRIGQTSQGPSGSASDPAGEIIVTKYNKYIFTRVKISIYLYQLHNCIISQGSDVRRNNGLSSSPGNVSLGNKNNIHKPFFIIEMSPTILSVIISPLDGMSSVAAGASGQPSGVPFLDNSSDEESGT